MYFYYFNANLISAERPSASFHFFHLGSLALAYRLQTWAYCSQPAGSTFSRLFARSDHFSFIVPQLAKSSIVLGS